MNFGPCFCRGYTYKLWARRFYKRHREERILYNKLARKKIKLKALRLLSGLDIPKCAKCNCDNIGILEIAHINHDGAEDRKTQPGGYHMQCALIKGRRTTEGLKVLCMVCNKLEYAQHKFGETGHTVIWERIK